MGINVIIQDESGERHLTWDFGRYAGDRDIPNALETVGYETNAVDSDDVMYRPISPDALLFEMLKRYPDTNTDRWKEMCEILKDGRWWLSFSW